VQIGSSSVELWPKTYFLVWHPVAVLNFENLDFGDISFLTVTVCHSIQTFKITGLHFNDGIHRPFQILKV